ncbi:hypothetical protein BOTNAR_0524g00050 [Botryotinia narcissicola]|uniref:B30.2/SPRY domain-containing protein n=1 Tax=Botryotinia narcissicola TaxID=278944 RepID=A0A4Z1HE67_9HELO|nr:hypothetical protein BOTNAR_0524g00050 [Botryotinia narcissicola]
MDQFEVTLYPQGEDGSGFRTKNERGKTLRRTLVDRGDTLVMKAIIKNITHGKLKAQDDDYATLLVFEFFFVSLKSSLRFIHATITLMFEDADGNKELNPEVYKIAPEGQIALNKTTTTRSITLGVNAGINVGVSGAGGNVGMNWEMKEKRTQDHFTRLSGRKKLLGRDYGPEDSAIWSLEESKDKNKKDGISSFLRTAVLLRRQDDVPFRFKLKVATDVDFVGELRSMLGLETRDPIYPVEIGPETKPAEFRIGSLDPETYDLTNLDALDLSKEVDIASLSFSLFWVINMAYNIHLVLVHGVTEYGSGGRNNQVKHFFEENFPRFTVIEFDFLDEKTASMPQERLLYHRAYELLEFVLDLRSHNQWSLHSSSVIFAGHNIGGSLAQQALSIASKIPKYHTIATSTAALLMQVLPEDLKAFHAYNSRCVRAHQVISISESIAMESFSTLIVDQESSVFDPKNDLNVKLVCNHLDLWQFHEGHTSGEAVCQIVELIANSMTHTLSSKFYEFLKVLLPLSPAPYQARTDAAMPMLVRWIRSNHILKDWNTATSNGVLCLHGPPGSAAACLTPHILSSLFFDGNPNPPIIIGFSFDRYYTDSRSALSFFTSLVYQILLARPWLFHQICKLGEEMMTLKLFTQESFWVVLNRLLRASFGSSVICIIESAHECGGPFDKIFQDLQQLVLLSRGSFKVVLTFNDPYVIHFEDETFYDIFLDSDIEAIIAKSIIQLKANDLIKERPSWITMEKEMIEELCSASTIYTTANLNIDLLRRANIRTTKVAIKEVLHNLPNTLEMYYDLKIHNIIALKDTWVFSALKWLTFAARPLTETELAVAVAFEEFKRDQPPIETLSEDRISSDIIQDLNRYIGSFFKVVDTNIQFVYSEFRSSLAQHFGSNGPAEMLVSCIDYIQLFVRQISLREGNISDLLSKVELSFFSYAIDSWPDSLYGTKSLLAGLDIAAHFGHEHVTNLLIQHGVVSELALGLGVQSGNINVVKRLLPIENDINKTDAKSNTPLHYAAARGSLDMSFLLLKGGADKNVNRADGSIAIHLAATAGHLAIVKLLFETEVYVTDTGYDSLQLASQCGHSDVVEYLLAQSMDFHHSVTSQMLLDQNAKVNVENEEGLTPLHLAAREGSEEIMQQLLDVDEDTSEDFGPDRSCTENKAYFIDGSHKMSPLQIAASVGHINIAKLLLLQTAPLPEDISAALYYAATGGHIRVVKRLMKTEVNDVTKDKDGNTALHMAIEWGHLEVIMLLLEQECFQVDTENENKWTPLHCAAKIGRPKIVEQLLALGANSLNKTADGATPLHIAAEKGHLRVFQILMSAGQDALQIRDELEFFPFMLAVQNGHLSLVQELMQSWSFKTDDLYPLHIAATQDNCEMIELLLRYSQNWTKKANIDVGNDTGDTPLSVAVRYGHIEIMKVLIQHGADINATNNKNDTPIFIAAYAGNTEVVRALLSRSPLPDLAIQSDSEWTALHAAFDNLEITRMLLEKSAAENLPKSKNNTPLHFAASYNEYGTFCLLLETDWGKSLSTESLSAAFRFAAYGGALDITKDLLRKDIDINAHVEIVQFLLQEGADVHKVSKMYNTPLLLAAQFNERGTEIVNLLITHGSDVNTVGGGQYYTALQAAAANGNCDIIDLLIQNNARINEVGGKYDTALAAAVHSQNEAAIVKLLDAGADPNVGNEEATALQRAASNAMISTVELLLRKGARVNDVKPFFGSALHAAIGSGSLKCVDILLQNDANIDLRVPNHPLPVQYAVLESHEDIFLALLERNADITAKDQDGHSILMYGIFSNQEDIMNALLMNESVIRSINHQAESGDTALLIAAKRSSEFVEDLLKHGADPNSQDSEGKTPLIHAASMETQSTKIISLLLEHDADPTIKDCRLRGPLYWVSLDGYTADFKIILEKIKDKCDIVDYVFHCESAISAAVAGDDSDILSELLNDESLNPNATRDDGWTPLYTAEIYGLSSIKSQLLHVNSVKLESGPKSIGKQSIGLVRADNPMPGRGVYYFEATILEGAKAKLIGIGFCKEQTKLNQMLGWGLGSWGYHGDDGNSFKEGLMAEYGEQYDTGDVIGCGVDFDRETAFYTKNGVFIGDAFSGIRGKLYPAVSFRANGEKGIGGSVSVKFWDNKADFCYKDPCINLENLDSTGTWNPT